MAQRGGPGPAFVTFHSMAPSTPHQTPTLHHTPTQDLEVLPSLRPKAPSDSVSVPHPSQVRADA